MADLWSTIGGALPVVGGLAGALINNASVDAANAANRRFQIDMQDKQNAYNERMWNLQNEYNSPAKTRERLVAGGYNPALMYGSPTGNVASAPQRASEARMVYQPHPAVDIGGAAASSIRAFNDLRLGAAQANNLQAQTTNTIATAVKTSVETILEQLGFKPKQDNLAASTNALNADADVKRALMPHQADALDAKTNKDNADVYLNFSRNEREQLLASTSIREAVARIASMRIQNAVLQNKSAAEIDRLKADTSLLLQDGRLKDMDENMRRHGVMPHDNPFYRAVSGFINGLFPGSSPTAAGGADDYQSPAWLNQYSRGWLRIYDSFKNKK